MYKCQNCGAEYEASLRTCPYCGTENAELAQKEYQEELARIDKKSGELPHLPRRIVNLWTGRMTRFLLITITAVLAAGILGAGGKAVYTYFSNKAEPERQERYLRELDQYIEAHEYEALREYMRQKDLYGGVYDEYWDICSASYSLDYVEQCREYLDRGGLWRSTLGWTLLEAAEGIQKINEKLESRVYVHGADEALISIREELESLLTEDLGLSEKELEDLFALYQSTKDMEISEEKWMLFCEAGMDAVTRKGIRVLEEDEFLP